MKYLVISAILASAMARAGLEPLGFHIDIRCHFSGGEWECVLRTDAGNFEPESAFLPLADKAYVNGNPAISGARHSQPASAAFSFTGAAVGQPLWIAVQGTPGIGEAWPGIRNDQPEDTFGAYIPADTRVSQATARP